MSGVPTVSEELNTWFTQTWYDIKPEATDNILDATPISALLKMKGCFKTQIGGDLITKTIRYGEKGATAIKRGSTLPVTEPELKTQARWDWAYWVVPITRTFIDDQQNAGTYKITDYVNDRLTAAREGCVQKIESVIMATTVHASGSEEPLSLFDYIPSCASTQYFSSSYTYGGIERDNTWWQHEDFTYANTASGNYNDDKDGPASMTMLDDMENARNTAGKQLSYPDIYITEQTLYEIFASHVMAKEQLIKDDTTRMADLGYDVLRFHGDPVTWSASMAGTQEMIMLNSRFLDVVYDPRAWFELTSWERPPRQLEQVAYIICAMQIIGHNPRFNARVRWAAI